MPEERGSILLRNRVLFRTGAGPAGVPEVTDCRFGSRDFQPNSRARRRSDYPDRPMPEILAPTSEFLAAAGELGIQFDNGDVERLGRFLALMLEVNQTHNLTAITDPAQAWMKHIFDALTLVPVIASAGSSDEATKRRSDEGAEASSEPDASSLGPQPSALGPSLIDIGSGGGVPALPLAIVMPELRFTLVEATGKKVEFLRRVVKEMNLANVDVIQGRAEALGQDHKAHREKYDIATARALGHLAIVAELLGPLVKPNGLVIAVKGQKADQELAEAKEALGMIGLRHAETVSTPTGRLVVLEKTTRTPRVYPRRDGEPARVPLGMKR